LASVALIAAAMPDGDWETYANVRYGYSVCYPPNLLHAEREADNSDGRAFTSTDGARLLVFGSNNVSESSLTAEAEAQANNYLGSNGKVTYRADRPNWIVISGEDGAGAEFYTKTFVRGDQFVAFQLKYPKTAAARYKPVIERLNRCFVLVEPAF
jgi:hypothetical protein